MHSQPTMGVMNSYPVICLALVGLHVVHFNTSKGVPAANRPAAAAQIGAASPGPAAAAPEQDTPFDSEERPREVEHLDRRDGAAGGAGGESVLMAASSSVMPGTGTATLTFDPAPEGSVPAAA